MAAVRLFWSNQELLLLLVAVVSYASSTCYDLCDCLGDYIDCSSSTFSEVPTDLPNWVKELDLSDNENLILTEGAFSYLPELEELTLDKLRLKTLPYLGSLPHLKSLSLSKNALERLDAKTATGFPALQRLDMSHNRISHLKHLALANLTLHELNLSDNLLVDLDPAMLKHEALKDLVDLRLSNNAIHSFALNRSLTLFSNLGNLKTLELSGNQLHTLDGLIFKGLKNLRSLRLKRNEITELSDGAFFGLDSLSSLRLDKNELREVSKNWLFGLKRLKHLALSNNKIDTLRLDAWQDTQQLVTLDLSYNELVSLKRTSFDGLGKLRKLLLRNNHLTHIEENTFASTPNLVELDLSFNDLRWNVEDSSGAFRGLANLRRLSLTNNNITSIHSSTFEPLRSLTHLDLRANEIRTLPSNPFLHLNLSTLYLNTSHFVCDGQLQWLPQWLSKVSFNTSTVLATCSYPQILQGMAVMSLSPLQFVSSLSPKPDIKLVSESQIALKGGNLSLVCVAEAVQEGGTSEDNSEELIPSEGNDPQFLWKKDNKLIDLEGRTNKTANVIDGGGEGKLLVSYTSHLVLQNMTDEDAGLYQCIAMNQFGTSYSTKARVMVHVFPYFNKKPNDLEVKEGNLARLECSASGSPLPEISWQKDGGDNFPAAKERRLRVIPQDNVFFIVPVYVRDEGVYSCRANNEAGTAVVNATIKVHKIPELIKAPEDKEARPGETAILECQGSGRPEPKVAWFKDGQELNGTSRHLFTPEKRFLIIMKSQITDEGTYTCELTNTLGTVRGAATLQIKTETSPTFGIVMMAVVCCVVVTSLVWVIIIYHTRKRAQANNSAQYRATYASHGGAYTPYPPPIHATHITTADHLSTFAPLMTDHIDHYKTSTPQLYLDNNSEHSSGKDSGTGDSAKRSDEDLPLVLGQPGMRRSLVICAETESTPSIKGVFGVNNLHSTNSTMDSTSALTPCDDHMRPRLSTFSPQHLSPNSGHTSPSLHVATLRRGSASRLLHAHSPIISTLPRHPHRLSSSLTPVASPTAPASPIYATSNIVAVQSKDDTLDTSIDMEGENSSGSMGTSGSKCLTSDAEDSGEEVFAADEETARLQQSEHNVRGSESKVMEVRSPSTRASSTPPPPVPRRPRVPPPVHVPHAESVGAR